LFRARHVINEPDVQCAAFFCESNDGFAVLTQQQCHRAIVGKCGGQVRTRIGSIGSVVGQLGKMIVCTSGVAF
jgi:hypothetical protein